MRTLKYYMQSPEVYTLCEILYKLKYDITVSNSFTLEVDRAVRDFQLKNCLVSDGIVGMKTWQVLFEKKSQILNTNDLFLCEDDLKNFAREFGLELAAVKAVNEVESSGKGFLINRKPKILFEGHVFWRELKKRGISPELLRNSANANVLYSSWTRSFYLGGEKEYNRLDEAININRDPKVREAALASASWGSFQIMGFHAKSLGYTSVQDFTDKMYLHEREHLRAFGKFLQVNGILNYLKARNWAKVAEKYNGAGYRTNKYDEKLARAYQRYSRERVPA